MSTVRRWHRRSKTISFGGAGSPQAPSVGGHTRGLKSSGGDRTEGGRDKDRVTDGLCCPCCLQREPRPWLEADAEQSIPMAPALVQGSLCSPQTPLLRDLPSSLGN